MYHRSEEEELLLMQGLCNLSSLRGFHYHLVEEGLLAVIEKASISTVKRCHVIASECLKNLSTCPRTRGKLIDFNVMKLLVVILTNETIDVRINCLNTFFNFCMDSSCVSKVASTQVLHSVIVMCLTSTSVALCRSLARLMKILCSYPSIAAKLIQDRVIAAFEHITEHTTKCASSIHFCAEALRFLYSNAMFHSALHAQSALSLLLNLSNRCSSPVTREVSTKDLIC